MESKPDIVSIISSIGIPKVLSEIIASYYGNDFTDEWMEEMLKLMSSGSSYSLIWEAITTGNVHVAYRYNIKRIGIRIAYDEIVNVYFDYGENCENSINMRLNQLHPNCIYTPGNKSDEWLHCIYDHRNRNSECCCRAHYRGCLLSTRGIRWFSPS